MLVHKTILSAITLSFLSLTACQSLPDSQRSPAPKSSKPSLLKADMISTLTDDGVTIFGEAYYGELSAEAPLILLFHQGGSNGRGEYEPIARWLNTEGFRAIAWDQRTGGGTYGHENRTVKMLSEDIAADYCDAYPDLQAALDYTLSYDLADEVIIWGSSYSGALVFQLAANNPNAVSGVLSFSPATGGTMIDCRARLWVEEVDAPSFVLKPQSEMLRDSSVEQEAILKAAGMEFDIIENGVHGSSMLVDDRTGFDMSKAREKVRDWLKALALNKG